MPILDLSINELLTTTRTVRRRLDLTRPVEAGVIQQCLELAIQAPSCLLETELALSCHH